MIAGTTSAATTCFGRTIAVPTPRQTYVVVLQWGTPHGSQGTGREPESGLDPITGQTRMRFEYLVEGLAGGELLQNQLDGDARSRYDRLAHQNGGIRPDEIGVHSIAPAHWWRVAGTATATAERRAAPRTGDAEKSQASLNSGTATYLGSDATPAAARSSALAAERMFTRP